LAVGPLICPRCQGAKRIIAFIEDNQIIRKILRYHGRWEPNDHDPAADAGMAF